MLATEISTHDRILEATLEVLGRSGTRLSLSDVAAEAGVSRPTLYRWFPTKDILLAAFGAWEQAKFEAGLAAAIRGLKGHARLDALLRHIVEFQSGYSLRRMLDVEPEHVLSQLIRVRPTMEAQLRPHFSGPNAAITAKIVTRIALSHALIPDDDPDGFLTELCIAAGVKR